MINSFRGWLTCLNPLASTVFVLFYFAAEAVIFLIIPLTNPNSSSHLLYNASKHFYVMMSLEGVYAPVVVFANCQG